MSPLYTQDFYQIRTLRPPLPEQTEIVSRVDVLTGHQNAAIARVERQIKLMQEYRTRLVADVVTGKLDVRAAAANLPEEAEEVEEPEVEAQEELEEADEEAVEGQDAEGEE